MLYSLQYAEVSSCSLASSVYRQSFLANRALSRPSSTWMVSQRSNGLRHIYQTDGVSRILSTMRRIKSPIWVIASDGSSSSNVSSNVFGLLDFC